MPISASGPTAGGSEPPLGPPADEDASLRKLAAKRYNEGAKLVASALNTLGFGVIQPLIKDPAAFVLEYRPVWYFMGLGLHIVAQVVLRFELRSEE